MSADIATVRPIAGDLEWLSLGQLADWLGITKTAVYSMNHKRSGPRYIMVGREVRYRRDWVEEWVAAKLEAEART